MEVVLDHHFFALIGFVIFALILMLDRKNARDYIAIGLLAMAFDAVFEVIPIENGFWTYNSEPKILGFSFYMWILYIPYMSMCYFFGRRLVKYIG